MRIFALPVCDANHQELVKSECEKWAEEGINIKYDTRKDRAGYKAGNLKEGMRHAYVRSCEFVAMFDADFQPAPDFLVRTVPFLVHNPRLALVQTRWKFGESFKVQTPRRQPTRITAALPFFGVCLTVTAPQPRLGLDLKSLYKEQPTEPRRGQCEHKIRKWWVGGSARSPRGARHG